MAGERKRVLGVLVTEKNISLVFDGTPYNIPRDSVNYPILREKIEMGTYTDEDIESALSLRHMVKSKLKNHEGSLLYIDTDKQEIYFKETTRLPEVLEKKLLHGLQNGHSIESFVRFVENVFANPSDIAKEEFYLFLEAGNMPLTEDGCFLAYKKIRANYTDQHTGKMDNSVGCVVSMPREKCDTNRHVTCSTGLHFCSWEYLSEMAGQRVIIVKVNPKDVTSIPSDYSNTKGRTCRLEVIGEIKDWGSPVLEGKSFEEVEPVIEKPEVALEPLEKRVEPGSDTFASGSSNSPYAWIKQGVKAKLGANTVTILCNPFRKTKKPWMVEYADGNKVVKVRCSELEEIKK